jgi:hypothetical protein
LYPIGLLVTGGKDKSSFVPLYDIFQHFCEKQQLLYKDECLEIEFKNPKITGVLKFPFPIKDTNETFLFPSIVHTKKSAAAAESGKNVNNISSTTTSNKSSQQQHQQQSASSESLFAVKTIKPNLKSSSSDSFPKIFGKK